MGKINSHLDDKNPEGQASQASQASQPTPAVQAAQITDDGDGAMNRYGSFAGQRNNNDIKWFVDGCGYFYAMSVALQNAKESIWILDCRSFYQIVSFFRYFVLIGNRVALS